ncbi:MAG TPA: acyl-CoA carboxylase subunit epsilon [Microbacterium sp.]|nr:acyl-CoA carboxylase subunit epsilon [Microbacterium sp.]
MSPADGPGQDAGVDADGLRIEVGRGDPTPEELAAVIAVVTEAYTREAAEAIAETAPRPSAWRVSARALRAPLRRDIGWGRFGG